MPPEIAATMTSSDDGGHDVKVSADKDNLNMSSLSNSIHSINILPGTSAHKGEDGDLTEEEESFHASDGDLDRSSMTLPASLRQPKTNNKKDLDNSRTSMSEASIDQLFDDCARSDSDIQAIQQNKKKVGQDFLKALASGHESQLALLVNDSAAGALFDDVYEMGEVLGEGGFAFVYRCRHKKNGHDYAVKEILTNDYESTGESLRGEVNALKLLREGPYVVRLLDVFYEPEKTMMVQELMRGGDLLDKLTDIEVYEPKDARKVSRTLIEAIDYCHKKRICHRDIKPENVLLVNGGDDLTTIKLADFGCAKKITGPKCMKTLCGSPQYVAPELLTHEDGYDEACDMWSCGVVIYVLLGGYAPFDAPECELAELITAGVYEFHEEYWEEVPKHAKNLISMLLQVDPSDRYTPSQALECRWLRRRDKEILNSSLHESQSSFNAWLERRSTRQT